jgi:hypothetical protein
MKTSQFEGVKVALKQDRTGYILTLSIHPDDLPEEILRDFVGARYQVVMVRLNGNEQPMNRDTENGADPVKLAGMLCRDTDFQNFLFDIGNVFAASEKDAIDWMVEEFEIESRADLRNKPDAARRLYKIKEEFKLWKQSA